MKDHKGQVVLMSIFRFRGMARIWGMAQLGMMPRKLSRNEHLGFYRVLGTGGGIGYSGKPDFSQYALLTVWPSVEKALEFYRHSEIMEHYRKKMTEGFTVAMRPLRSRGLWSGMKPFIPEEPLGDGLPIAVITRARLKWRFIIPFWSRVKGVSLSQKRYKQIYSQGVGEWPWLYQSTFSIWASVEEMEWFAYSEDSLHKDAVNITRKKNGFREELYARFQVIGSDGSVRGVNPLPEHLKGLD